MFRRINAALTTMTMTLVALLLPLVEAVLIEQSFLTARVSTIPSGCDNTSNEGFAHITEQQRRSAKLNCDETARIQSALAFERHNWANNSVYSEPFYQALPANASVASPGTLLAVQHDANTSAYAVPPSTSMARILYQTADLNGSAVPASAYLLFPYQTRPYYPPRQNNGGGARGDDGNTSSNTSTPRWPIVAWGHGTSGVFPNCAPSHIRNLWHQFAAPYELALQGYVVVAPDYAGLGVSHDSNGQRIYHQYCGNPAQANDLFYAVAAAQQAFPILSKEFVVMGHSQGGGAAWAAAQRQARTPVEGYLGAIAASPLTNLTTHMKLINGAAGAVPSLLSTYLPTFFPGFTKADLLTPDGLKRHNLQVEVEGCNSVASELLPYDNASNYVPDWPDTTWIRQLVDLTANGKKETAAPLLIMHGSADPAIPEVLTTKIVQETCAMYHDADIEYTVYENVTHSGMMFASRMQWLDWIADRFAGKPTVRENLCKVKRLRSAREGLGQVDLNWFLEYATSFYQVA